MSNRFDTALINREKTRQLLAEALDSKYDAERRNATIMRAIIVSLVLFAGFYAAKGASFLAASMTPEKRHPGAPSPQDILGQMKKQLTQGDQLVISGTAEAGDLQRSHSERASFSQERIPPNLYGELHRNRLQNQKKYSYSPANPVQRLESEDFQKRISRHPTVDYGKYRPAEANDLPKLPNFRSHPTLPRPDQSYAQLPKAPLSLASDRQKFPR